MRVCADCNQKVEKAGKRNKIIKGRAWSPSVWPGWCFILGGLFFRWSDGEAVMCIETVRSCVDGLMMAYVLTVIFLLLECGLSSFDF